MNKEFRWAAIASHLPGRTDNEIKNFWNSILKKHLVAAKNQTIMGSPSMSGPGLIRESKSGRVESSEARLSMESSSAVKAESDIFLKLWNSEVGESFRKNLIKPFEENQEACGSLVSQTSLSKTSEPDSNNIIVRAMQPTTSTSTGTSEKQDDGNKPNADNIASDHEFLDSSDTELKMLFDLPGGSYIEFLQGKTDTFLSFLHLQCDRKCNSPAFM